MTNEFLFSQSESQLSSGFRELLSVVHAFKVYSSYFKQKRNSLIIWLTDSACLCSFLEKGSRNLEIQKVVLKIKIMEFELGLKIKPKWLSRETGLIRQADLGSKIHLNSDQYGLCDADFNLIQKFAKKKFSIDGFSSSLAKRCLKFICPCPQEGCLDVDFFTHKMLSDEMYFIHPPPKYLIRVVNKILCYANVRGCIILPIWKSHSFWNYFVKIDRLNWFIKDFKVFSPFYVSYTPKTMFQGYKKFRTLAVIFDTATKNNLRFVE